VPQFSRDSFEGMNEDIEALAGVVNDGLERCDIGVSMEVEKYPD
jgi:hypothetical protein